MAIQRRPIEELNAYTKPRQLIEGCEHRLGCKCDPPFWLRRPSPAEKQRFIPERAILDSAD